MVRAQFFLIWLHELLMPPLVFYALSFRLHNGLKKVELTLNKVVHRYLVDRIYDISGTDTG